MNCLDARNLGAPLHDIEYRLALSSQRLRRTDSSCAESLKRSKLDNDPSLPAKSRRAKNVRLRRTQDFVLRLYRGVASCLSFCLFAAKGFQVEFHSHAEAILAADFPQAVSELEAVLLAASIPIEEITGRRRRGQEHAAAEARAGRGRLADDDLHHREAHQRRPARSHLAQDGSCAQYSAGPWADAVVALEIEREQQGPVLRPRSR